MPHILWLRVAQDIEVRVDQDVETCARTAHGGPLGVVTIAAVGVICGSSGGSCSRSSGGNL
jgi:N-acetylglucosamine kinase-like BadF-type ATPase